MDKDYVFSFKIKNDAEIIKRFKTDVAMLGGTSVFDHVDEYNEMHLLIVFQQGADQDSIVQALDDKHIFWLEIFY